MPKQREKYLLNFWIHFQTLLLGSFVPTKAILLELVLSRFLIFAWQVSTWVQFPFLIQTKIRINHGKDFTKDTVEINAFSDPGTYIGFSALQYDQFKFGANRAKEANIFFTKYAVSLAMTFGTWR